MYVGVHISQLEQKTMELSKNKCCWITPPKNLLLRTDTSQKRPQKNPGMGQVYIALLFCIVMVLISMGSRLWKSFRDMDEGVTRAGYYSLSLLTSSVGLQRGEKHLLISVKLSWITGSSLLYFKFRMFFFEVNMGGFLWFDLSVSHRCCSPVQNQSTF